MESRNPSKKPSIAIKSAVAERPEQTYNEKRYLQSLIDARLIYKGSSSGKLYEWPRAGSIVAVVAADADGLLARRIGSSGCCGGNSGGNKLFEEII